MCALGAGTHGDVLNVHTEACRVDTRGFFSVSHTTHHTAHHTAHTTTTTQPQHNHTETETETDRDRQRQTETEKEDRDRERREDGRGETRQEKRRQKKTRHDKRREKIHFQCGGAWPFFCLCSDFLVNSVCVRDLSLLNSVKYESSLISFSAPWQVNSFICE